MNKRDAHIEALKFLEGELKKSIDFMVGSRETVDQNKVNDALFVLHARLRTRIDRLVKDPRLPFPEEPPDGQDTTT